MVSALISFRPISRRLFWTFERQEGFLARVRKAITAFYFTQITWNVVQHIFGLLTLVTWSKWWRQHYFWWRNHSTTNFYFQIFPLPEVFVERLWLKPLLDVLLHIFDDSSNIQNTRKAINNTYLHSQPPQAHVLNLQNGGNDKKFFFVKWF